MKPKPLLVKGAALAIIAALYALSTPPRLAESEMEQLACEFSFTRTPLFEPAGSTAHFIRTVHPQYRHISAWMSSLGAAVTLTDFDNNGRANDIIHVDPRFDQVLVSPLAGTAAGYLPFVLRPAQLPYDAARTAPMGTLAYDFNADGRTDILVYYWGRTPIIFYQQQHGFTEAELNPTVERWFTNTASLADFDRDGKVDILIANYFPDGAAVLDGTATDQDQQMQHSMSRAYNGGDDHFFLFSGLKENKASFTEHGEWKEDLDYRKDWTLAVGAADLDNDLLPEIYFANDFGPDRLLHNLSTPGRLRFRELKGVRRFTDIRSGVLGRDSFKGMGVSFGDVNNDGLPDIFVSNITAEYALEESHFLFVHTGEMEKMKEGIAPFVNRSEALGLSRSSWSWDARLADLNNDGNLEALQATGFVKGSHDKWAELQELAIGNDELMPYPEVWPRMAEGTELIGHGHNPFFVKSSSGRYYDLAARVGVAQPGVSRAIALSDMDHDGDLDYVTARQFEPSLAYVNQYPGTNRFLGLQLLRATGGITRPAIGATVTVRLPGGRTIPAYVDGGTGHSGRNSPEVFVGLGAITADQEVTATVRWVTETGRLQQHTYTLKAGWHSIILPN